MSLRGALRGCGFVQRAGSLRLVPGRRSNRLSALILSLKELQGRSIGQGPREAPRPAHRVLLAGSQRMIVPRLR